MVTGVMPWLRGVWYILAQSVGAIIGALAVRGSLPTSGMLFPLALRRYTERLTSLGLFRSNLLSPHLDELHQSPVLLFLTASIAEFGIEGATMPMHGEPLMKAFLQEAFFTFCWVHTVISYQDPELRAEHVSRIVCITLSLGVRGETDRRKRGVFFFVTLRKICLYFVYGADAYLSRRERSQRASQWRRA